MRSILLCVLVLAATPVAAESSEKTTVTLSEPPKLHSGNQITETFVFSPENRDTKWVFATGLHLTVIPKNVAESETRFFPLIEGYANKDFLNYFSWGNSIGVLYIQNYASTGLSVFYHFPWFSLSVGVNTVIWMGHFQTTGFDSQTYTWVNNPMVSIGKNLRKYYYWLPDSLSVTFKLNRLNYQYIRLGTAELERRRADLEGYTIDIMAEYGTGSAGIYFGLRINHARPGYQFWLAFSDYDYAMNFTTLYAGYRF